MDVGNFEDIEQCLKDRMDSKQVEKEEEERRVLEIKQVERFDVHIPSLNYVEDG